MLDDVNLHMSTFKTKSVAYLSVNPISARPTETLAPRLVNPVTPPDAPKNHVAPRNVFGEDPTCIPLLRCNPISLNMIPYSKNHIGTTCKKVTPVAQCVRVSDKPAGEGERIDLSVSNSSSLSVSCPDTMASVRDGEYKVVAKAN